MCNRSAAGEPRLIRAPVRKVRVVVAREVSARVEELEEGDEGGPGGEPDERLELLARPTHEGGGGQGCGGTCVVVVSQMFDTSVADGSEN